MSDGTLELFAKSLVPAALDKTTVSDRRTAIETQLKAQMGAFRLFESGSWSHGTSIKSHSDVDYMVSLPETKRPVLPSSALTSLKSATAGAHWAMIDRRISSPTVKVEFYSPPNFELVPAYYKGEKDGISVWRIPGPGDQWVESIPTTHNAWVNLTNDDLSKKVKTLIRLVKAWKYAKGVPVSSFYLEMRTTKHASGESSIYYDIDLRLVIAKLITTEMRSMNDPLGVVPRIPATSSEANRVTAVRQAKAALAALEAAKVAREAGNKSDYWSHMYDVFGSDYPYPSW